MNYQRNTKTQKRKGGSKSKEKSRTFSSKEIIDKMNVLKNRYIHYTGNTLHQVVFNKDSKIPFSEIIRMIKNCEDLETQYSPQDKTYILSFLVKKYVTDINFLNKSVFPKDKISKQDIYHYSTQYLQVIIACIREYLTNDKYKHHHKHFYDTIQDICRTGNNTIKSVISLLQKLNDPLLENPELITLCEDFVPTYAQYAELPIGIRTKHTDRFFTSASESATEAPRDLTPVRAKQAPIYRDELTGEEIYDIPPSWSPDISQLLTKRPRSRSRSRGGKRKTQKSTKRK